MKIYLKAILTLTLASSALFAGCSGTSGESTIDMNRPEIEGYDSVSYFAVQKAVKGVPQLAYVWKGAVWYFSSQENLDRFKVEPDKYTPQLGSYCPISLSKGGKAIGKPGNWKIFNDKLYLFAKEEYIKEFEQGPEEVLKSATENYIEH